MKKKPAWWVAPVTLFLVWLVPMRGIVLGQNGVGINTIVIARDVIDRAPVDPGTEFPSDVGKLFCFTAVNNPGDPVTLTHVWNREGEEMARVDMTIGTSPNWRAWSIKTILPDWTGAWSVSVLDTAGGEIARADFTVVAPVEAVPEVPEVEEEAEMPQPEVPEVEEEEAAPPAEEPLMPQPEAVEEAPAPEEPVEAPEEEPVPVPEDTVQQDTATTP